jgi:hypothetical protein
MPIIKAEFSQKGEKYKPRKIEKINKVQKLLIESQENRQLSWNDDEKEEKGLKIITLKNMFNQEEIGDEVTILQEGKIFLRTQGRGNDGMRKARKNKEIGVI